MRMKKLLTFLTLLTLFFGVGWAADQTITITYNSFGFNSTSYSKKTATIGGYSFTVDQGCRGGTSSNYYLQMNSSKGSGTLYNTTAIPGLKSIKINVANGNKTYTITTGNSQNPTSNSQTGTNGGTYNAVSGDQYFQLKVSGASYFSSIVITYDPEASSVETYNVTCDPATNGSISVGSTTSFAEGATVTVTAIPANGYKLSTVTVTPTESGVTAPTATITGNTATFTMPASDVTVSASFTETVVTQYKLVESATDLVAGAEYIIAGKQVNATDYTGLLGAITLANSNSIGSVVTEGFTYDSSTKTLTLEDVCDVTPLILGGSTDAWTLYNGNVFLSYSGGGNTLNSTTEVSNNYAKWKIDTQELSTSKLLISNAGTSNAGTERYIAYNAGTTPKRFACYLSTGLNTVSPIALFKKVEVGAYTVECADGIEHGSISASPSTADAGKTITVTATPDAGYELSTVTVTPESGSAPEVTISGNSATFEMPASNVTVSATFALAKNKVAYTIAPANSGEVWLQNGATYDESLGYSYSTMGTTVSIALAAYAGYDVNSLTITDGNGANVTYNTYNTEWVDGKKVTYYTFEMPATQVNIAATFKSGDIYILGTANDNSWNGNKGVKMTYNANTNTYSADVYFATATDTGKGQFSFATNLSGTDGSWANIGKRWGAQEQDYDLVTNASGGTWTENNSNPNRFAVPYGVYTIRVNWGTGLVTATKKDVTVSLNPAAGQVETGTTVTISSNLTSLLQACKSGVSATLAYSTDGENFTDGSSYTLNSNTTLTGRATYGTIEKTAEATYTVVTHYAISCSANPTKGGSVKAYIGEDQVTSAIAGDVITLDVTTKNGYEISSVTLNGDELAAVDGVYSFTMPAEAAVVVANFAAKILTLSVDNDNNKGTVAGIPATSTVGSPINFTVTPHSGYSVASVTYSFTPDGGEQNTQTLTATDGAYKFNMPGYDVTISVTYNEEQSGGTGETTDLYHESFGNNSNSARDWIDDYSVKTGVASVYENVDYTVTNAKQSKNTMGYGDESSALVSGQGETGVFIVGPLSVANYTDLEVTNYFGMSAGTWQDDSFMKLSYSTDNTNYTEVTREGSDPTGAVSNNSKYALATYSLPAAAESSNLYLKFEFYCYNLNKNGDEIGQAYLDEVNLSGVLKGLSDPVFTPAAGIYDIDVDVTIDCSTSGATIYYTTDGSEPSATNGTEYTGEIVVSETTTFKAIAIKDSEVSNVVTATYTISKSSTVETVFPTYSEPFTSGIGKFHVENGDGFSPVWTLDGNYGVKGTAYSNGTNYAATSRLISPIIDLSDASVPELTFSHQINSYFTDPTTQCQLFIRETTNGTSGTWVELDGLSFTTPASGTWSNDFADIDLSDYVGKKIQISFLYTNPEAGSGAGTWEIQNFVVADNSDIRWVNNIAEFNTLESGTKAKFRNPVTVLYDYSQYSKGTYQEYIWVKDESGYTQIFLQPSLDGQYNTNYQRAFYENGDVIPAGFEVIMNWYEEGKYYQAMSNSATEEDRGGFKEATEKALADPEPFTAAQLAQLGTDDATVETYNNRYISISKIRIASKNDLNFRFQDEDGNGSNIAGYNKYSNTNSRLKDGETTAVVTVPDVSTTAYYNVTAILQTWQGGWEIMPITFTPWEEKTVTLRELCDKGVVNEEYTISNPLQVVYVDTDRNSVWVKDDNGQSIWSTSPAATDKNFAIDYADNTRDNQAYYDQSNWCQLVFDGEIPSSLSRNPIINGGMIKGTFTNKLNPTLSNVVLGDEPIMQESSSYATNYYVARNFAANSDGYFFMNPKPQEYADIVWAIYDSSNNAMIMTSNPKQNPNGFVGSFKVDMSMNIKPNLELVDGTQTGKGYEHFKAIVRLASTSNAPMLKDRMPANAEYVVFPLDITQDVPTGITDVNGKAVKSVKYVNVAGVMSDVPFEGVNIVVTEYTDGSRSTSKMIKR